MAASSRLMPRHARRSTPDRTRPELKEPPMVRIALDPTPYHHDFSLLEFPEVAARLGYEHMQLTPHADFAPFFRYPKADVDLVARLKKAASDAGVGIPAILPVHRISS